MDFFINFIISWCILVVIAIVLISLRSDARTVAEDIDNCFINKKFWVAITSFILIWSILPLSIPYSLGNILNKKK